MVIFAHAWSNTMSFFILGLSLESFIPGIVVAVLTWFLADYLSKEYKNDKKST
jgi:hypothetical protein